VDELAVARISIATEYILHGLAFSIDSSNENKQTWKSSYYFSISRHHMRNSSLDK
jgi:hypothetical protein